MIVIDFILKCWLYELIVVVTYFVLWYGTIVIVLHKYKFKHKQMEINITNISTYSDSNILSINSNPSINTKISPCAPIYQIRINVPVTGTGNKRIKTGCSEYLRLRYDDIFCKCVWVCRLYYGKFII